MGVARAARAGTDQHQSVPGPAGCMSLTHAYVYHITSEPWQALNEYLLHRAYLAAWHATTADLVTWAVLHPIVVCHVTAMRLPRSRVHLQSAWSLIEQQRSLNVTRWFDQVQHVFDVPNKVCSCGSDNVCIMALTGEGLPRNPAQPLLDTLFVECWTPQCKWA